MKEIWKPVPGYEGLYEVSSEGRVKSLARVITRADGRTKSIRQRILKPLRHSRGYTQVVLCGPSSRKQHLVHVLVAAAFRGQKPAGMECCHNNGVRSDNRSANVRYGTAKENCKDRRVHGTHPMGEMHRNSKITTNDVRSIRKMAGRLSQAQIAKQFGIAQTTVSKIIRQVRWAHV